MNNIANERKKLGITQSALACACGWNQSRLANYEAGTVIGTASQTMKPNLFYNKFFCGLGTIPLPKLNSIDSAVATYEGFSIRVHKYADGDANVQKMRFDLLPAYVCFNPHMGGQFFGNP